MSLLIVGSVALDSVETPLGSVDDALGGSASYASVAASLFAPPRMVAVVGDDFPGEHVALFRTRGVALEGLEQRPGQTFRWRGRYGEAMDDAQTLATELNVFKEFSPKLPSPWRGSEIVLLGNIAPELQLSVLEQLERPRLVAADTMNYWIHGSRAALKRVLARIDLLFINETELHELTCEEAIPMAARAIHALGPRWVVVKRGANGSMLFGGERPFALPAYPIAALFDPTGAGDSFAGGFLGFLASERRLDERALRQAMAIGTVTASFTVEHFSLDGLRAATAHKALERFRTLNAMTQFDDHPGTGWYAWERAAG